MCTCGALKTLVPASINALTVINNSATVATDVFGLLMLQCKTKCKNSLTKIAYPNSFRPIWILWQVNLNVLNE